jgi:release factor glutamine methyltransferase
MNDATTVHGAASQSGTTVRRELRAAADHLATLPGARREAAALLAHVLGCTPTQFVAHDDESLSAAQATSFRALVARRAAGEPFAYLTGRREFWSLSLMVSPSVLIPRPETELLVEHALALLANHPARVADLGTGSGAIALACAVERPTWDITATDVSSEALTLAAANARMQGCGQIRFVQGSWYQPLQGQRFDLILSNPPYIAAADPALHEHGLPYEPQTALVSGRDGLDALRELIAGAPAHLLPGGALLLEHGAEQCPAVARLLVEAGFGHVRCHPDLAGLPRVTTAMEGLAHGTV